MKNLRHAAASVVLTLALLPAVRAAADDAKTTTTEDRNEIVVFGGISLLDVSRSGEASSVSLDRNFPMTGGFGVRFGRLPFPLPIPPISGQLTGSLGSSVLFGARYSREIKERLALEADVTIAPSHTLETRGTVCAGDLCFGGPNGGRGPDGRVGLGFGDRNVTAWHYGAGLAYELTGGDVRPLLILGAGGVTWDGARESGTDFVFRFGAGLKILFGRVGARVDVVDHLVLDQFLTGKTEHDVHATAGLLVRF